MDAEFSEVVCVVAAGSAELGSAKIRDSPDSAAAVMAAVELSCLRKFLRVLLIVAYLPECIFVRQHYIASRIHPERIVITGAWNSIEDIG